MIMPLSFPGIDTVTKFKLHSCPENVSFMCVSIYTSIYFFLFGFEILEPLKDHPLQVVIMSI